MVGGEHGDWLLDMLKPEGLLVPIAWGRHTSEKASNLSITVQEVQYPEMTSAYLEELAWLVNNVG